MAGATDVRELAVVADYQFGAGAGAALFEAEEDYEVERSRTGRPRQVIAPAGRLVTLIDTGRLTLGLEGGRRLHAADPPPTNRVAVTEDSVPFVREGRSAFAKFVTEVDPSIRGNDEVLVVGPDDAVLGVGRAELSAAAMDSFETGVAVMVREGAGDRD